MFKSIKRSMIFLLCMTMPAWGIEAAVIEGPMMGTSSGFNFVDRTIDTDDWAIPITEIEFEGHSFSVNAVDDLEFLIDVSVSDSDVQEASQLLEAEISEPIQNDNVRTIWTGRNLVVGTLLLSGLLVGILMLFGGTGSGGAGSSAGGGGGTIPGSIPPFNPQDAPFGQDPQALSGDGSLGGGGGSSAPSFLGGLGSGEGGRSSAGSSAGQNVPINPEPSSMLLMGLGIALPFIKRMMGSK